MGQESDHVIGGTTSGKESSSLIHISVILWHFELIQLREELLRVDAALFVDNASELDVRHDVLDCPAVSTFLLPLFMSILVHACFPFLEFLVDFGRGSCRALHPRMSDDLVHGQSLGRI